jgi:hypothetical protein
VIPEKSRVAVVVAHPAHILTIGGLIQRYQPGILVCNSSESSNAGPQKKIVQAGLALLGIRDSPAFLDIDEPEAYGWAHARNWSPFTRIRDSIARWLTAVQPDVVLGDAFECANYQHDVVRLMLDSALQRSQSKMGTVTNYEFPLVCRTVCHPESVQYQMFPSGNIERLQLTSEEIARKEQLIHWAWPQSEFIAEVAPMFPPLDSEPIRKVAPDRDYTQVPEGLLKHYDRRGQEMVAQGIHKRPIRFEKHFLPLVKAMGMSTSTESKVA